MRSFHLCFGLAILVLSTSAARAVVTDIDAAVGAEVTEFVDGAALNTDSAFEDLNDTAGQFPLEANASLSNASEDQAGTSATVNVVLSDPRDSTSANPQEFALDLVATSQVQGVSYSAEGEAMESRDVTFTSQDVGFADGTPLTARSFFFLDGVIAIWTTNENVDLSATDASIDLKIVQNRTEAGATVLQASVQLSGNAQGEPDVVTSGAIAQDNIVLLDVSDVASGGLLFIVRLPDMVLDYTYEAVAGEAFTLEATVAVDGSAPLNTGAAVFVGRDDTEISSAISEAAGLSQAAVLDALSNAPSPVSPLTGTAALLSQGTIIAAGDAIADYIFSDPCGLFGGELGAAMVGLIMLRLASARRRA